MSWRARRVARRGVPFTDTPDSHGDLLSGAGETFSSLAPLPRPLVAHRLERTHERSRSPFFEDQLDEQLVPPARRRSPLTFTGFIPALSSLRVIRSPGVPKRGPSLFSRDRERINASWREFNRLRLNPQARECLSRTQRREVLFARRVAGRNLRRSPGRGGGYRRNGLSQWSC